MWDPYAPNLNQEGAGQPRSSRWGRTFDGFDALPHNTVLPYIPVGIKGRLGEFANPSPYALPVYRRFGYGGILPTKMQPTIQRPKPWNLFGG